MSATAPAAPPAPGGAPAAGAALRRAGLVAVLFAACARAVTTHDPLPGWGLDPVAMVVPQDGLAPGADILLAALSFLGLALVLAGAARAREGLPALALVLGALGLVPVAWHAALGPDASLDNARLGCVWAGAVAGGLAALVACRHPRERALALAACAAIVGPLVFRAAIQVYSEHPIMVEDFRQRRAEILGAHGWSPDSPMARGYERRLSQPDASAWFAMSNVYASVMACCAAVFGAGVLAARRAKLWTLGTRHDRYRVAALGAGFALAVGGLLLAMPAGGAPSKGGVAAMILGLALLALAGARERLPAPVARLLRPGVVGLAIVGLALLAVVLRGLVGERLGELSLLFRWYYVQAAVRIFTEHPLWGVGPADFQAAYLLAKNPLSPEEVSSPHSVLFEFASTLGVLGLAWCALLLLQAALAGRALLHPPTEREPTPAPGGGASGVPWLAAIVVPCAILSFATEALPLACSVPEAFSLLLLDGAVKAGAWLLLWLGLGVALLGVGRSGALRAGLAAGALAMLAHAQIELTATDIGASAWAFAVLGAAAAPLAIKPAARPASLVTLVAAALACALALAVAAGAFVTLRWEAVLRASSRSVSESTALQQRYQALTEGAANEDPQAFLADLSTALGRPIGAGGEFVAGALADLRITRIRRAAETLETLARTGPLADQDTAHAAIRLYATESAMQHQLGHDPLPPLEQAHTLAAWAADRWPESSRSWRDLAQIRSAIAEVSPAAADTELEPLRNAAALDPYSPELAWRIAIGYEEQGRAEEAREWAARALGNHELRRLDPLAGLSEEQVEDLRELLGVP